MKKDLKILKISNNRITKVQSGCRSQAACGTTRCYVDARTGAQGYCYKRMKKIWRK